MTEHPPLPRMIDEWISWAAWLGANPRAKGENPFDAASSEFCSLTENEPDRAWEVIFAILDEPRAAPYLDVLAAGPLEDLLSFHGEAFIERVERAAIFNPRFATLLSGTGQFKMSEAIWSRVQAAWNPSEADGV